jgi:bifunctional NMN adenylyltransferase/nudix hydrolase
VNPIFLCGQQKDHSSFYVAKFPEWEPIGVSAQNHLISATDIRQRFFSPLPEIVSSHLPKGTINVLNTFMHQPEFTWLLDYYKAKEAHDRAWSAAPFPNKDQCADAVCIQSGHVLLVTRGKHPGKGLLALPGGHVNEFERIRDAAVRELKEETKLADKQGEIPAGRLSSYITAEKLYDDPYRSDFGRVISNAFLFRLPDAKPLWKVKGADDALDAKWYRIAELRPELFHDDHFFVIQDMLGL